MLNQNDVLAYLVVLNCRNVLNELSDDEKHIGRENMVGCLHRICDSMSEHPEYYDLLGSVRYREKLNGVLVHADPRLEEATANLAGRLYRIYHEQKAINS